MYELQGLEKVVNKLSAGSTGVMASCDASHLERYRTHNNDTHLHSAFGVSLHNCCKALLIHEFQYAQSMIRSYQTGHNSLDKNLLQKGFALLYTLRWQFDCNRS